MKELNDQELKNVSGGKATNDSDGAVNMVTGVTYVMTGVTIPTAGNNKRGKLGIFLMAKINNAWRKLLDGVKR